MIGYETNMKIIVTRPLPDADAFAAALTRLGAEPVISPVLAIRNRTAPIELGDAPALAFTSANGVRAFAALSTVRSLKVFAVGDATAFEARRAGFSDINTARGDVESLAALILQSKSTRKILHLAGSERAGDLARRLSEGGLSARRAVIYDAVEVDQMTPEAARAIAENAASLAIAFFSPRSARLFLHQARRKNLLDPLRLATALCMSDGVAAAAGDNCWQRKLTAAAPRSDAMLALVEALIAGLKGRTGAPR